MEKKELLLLPTHCRQAVIALVDGDGATGCAALFVVGLVTLGSGDQGIGCGRESISSKGVVVTRRRAASVDLGEGAIGGIIGSPFLLFQLKVNQSGQRFGTAALANVLLISGKGNSADNSHDQNDNHGFDEAKTGRFNSQIHRNDSLKYLVEASEYHDFSRERTAADCVGKAPAHP